MICGCDCVLAFFCLLLIILLEGMILGVRTLILVWWVWSVNCVVDVLCGGACVKDIFHAFGLFGCG